MDLHPGESVVYEGHPTWRDQSLMQRILRVGNVDFDTARTDDSDFVFDGISHPDRVVAAVDRAQRDATTPVER